MQVANPKRIERNEACRDALQFEAVGDFEFEERGTPADNGAAQTEDRLAVPKCHAFDVESVLLRRQLEKRGDERILAQQLAQRALARRRQRFTLLAAPAAVGRQRNAPKNMAIG